jgi:hypothetical protein
VETDITFDNTCNINACGVKYDGDCISGLVFVRGTLFDPAFGGLSGRYPRILRYPCKYVVSITYVNIVCTAVMV